MMISPLDNDLNLPHSWWGVLLPSARPCSRVVPNYGSTRDGDGRATHAVGAGAGGDPNLLDPNFLDPNFFDPNFFGPKFLDPNFFYPKFFDPIF